MVDAGRISKDQGRTRISLCLRDCLECLVHIRTHADLRDIDIAVGHRNTCEILLLGLLTACRKLCDCTGLGGLGGLTAGVRIHLGIEDEDVDILAGCEDVIHAAEADIVSPTVATEDPLALLVEEILLLEDLLRKLRAVLRKCIDQSFRCCAVRRTDLIALKPCSASLLGLLGSGTLCELLDLALQAVANSAVCKQHTVTELCVVLEEGVVPSRSLSLLVRRVRRGRRAVAPNRGAAGCIRNVHSVAEELGDKLCVRGLTAACTSARELKERLLELRALDGARLELLNDFLLLRKRNRIIKERLLVRILRERLHDKRLVLHIARADICAAAAARAVEDGDIDCELVARHHLEIRHLHAFRRLLRLFLGHCNRANRSVRADIGALRALDAGIRIPNRNIDRDTALLESSGAVRRSTVHIIHECGNRELVALLRIDRRLNRVDKLLNRLRTVGCVRELETLILCVLPALRNLNLVSARSTCIDCVPVLLDNILTLAAVGLLRSVLHEADCLLLRDDAGQLEECGLKNRVDTGRAHACLDTDLHAVNGVELNLVVVDVLLHLTRQMLLELCIAPCAVQQEGSAVHKLLNHVVLANISRVVASHEVCLVNQIGRLNRLVTEAEVGNRDTAGLLRVIVKVCLCIHVGVVTDDLDGVLVSTDRTVCAEAPELAVRRAFRRGDEVCTGLERKVGHIVHNADREALLLRVLEDSDNVLRRGVLGTQTVATREDRNVLELGVAKCRDHIEVERFTDGTCLLRSVKHFDALHRLRKSFDERLCAKRTVKANLHQTDLLALLGQIVNGLLNRIVDGTHCDDDNLCILCTVVVEELIVRAELCIDLVHVLLHNLRQLVIELVSGLVNLEEDVRVLCLTLFHCVVRVQCVVAECLDCVEIRHVLQILEIPGLNLLNLVGGTETVKEIDKRNSALDCGEVCHRRQVHDFLNGRLTEHCTTGLSTCVNVRVIAENAECVGCNRTRRDIDDAREHLARDFIEVRNHQKKTLRRRIGRGQRACDKGAVNRTCRTCLRLHLRNLNRVTEDVLESLCCPLIRMLSHRRRRGDRIDSRDIGERIRRVRRRLVTIHGFPFSCHVIPPK